jgi:hypothetical protein
MRGVDHRQWIGSKLHAITHARAPPSPGVNLFINPKTKAEEAMTENNQDTETKHLQLHDDGGVTLSKQRKLIALNAAWELNGIGKHLLALETAETTEGINLVKRGLNIRISELADVICGAIELPWCTLEDLQAKVGITSR